MPAGESKRDPLLPGILSEAGRIASHYSPVQRALIFEAEAATAPAGQATPWAFWAPGSQDVRSVVSDQQKPSRAAAREASQQAAQGVSLARQGRLAEAIARFQRSIELDPTSAKTRHNLGIVCLQAGMPEEAATAFAGAAELDPAMLAAQQQLASVLERLGQQEGAVAAYQAVVRLDPRQAMAQFQLARLYAARNRLAEAEAAFRAAAAASPGTPLARVSMACAADAAGDSAAAQKMLRMLIADHPAFVPAHMVLGEMLAHLGRSAEAAACIERGITLDPDLMAAWQGFATNTKFTASDRDLIGRIRGYLDRPNLTAAQRKGLNFALGKAHDDIGDYEAAMQHFDIANQIRAADARLNRARLAEQTGRLIAASPRGYLENCAHLGVADETPILIVGMPRSGTTLVEQILSSHPDVAPGGELNFWGEQNRAGVGILDAVTAPETARQIARDYLAVLRGFSPDAARVTDKMPFNFGMLGVIRQVFPRATIVHCRRHPVDTCLSIYATGFEAAIDFAVDRGSLVFFYRQYLRLMAHWREVLPAERFIEVDYETLVDDPESLTRRMVAACGLEWNDACLAPQRNRRRITTASVWQARQPIYRTSVARWRNYEPWLGELRQLLPHGEGQA